MIKNNFSDKKFLLSGNLAQTIDFINLEQLSEFNTKYLRLRTKRMSRHLFHRPQYYMELFLFFVYSDSEKILFLK